MRRLLCPNLPIVGLVVGHERQSADALIEAALHTYQIQFEKVEDIGHHFRRGVRESLLS